MFLFGYVEFNVSFMRALKMALNKLKSRGLNRQAADRKRKLEKHTSERLAKHKKPESHRHRIVASDSAGCRGSGESGRQAGKENHELERADDTNQEPNSGGEDCKCNSSRESTGAATTTTGAAARAADKKNVHGLNVAFARLKTLVPRLPSDKLSKIQTIRLATFYIDFLFRLLNDEASARSRGDGDGPGQLV